MHPQEYFSERELTTMAEDYYQESYDSGCDDPFLDAQQTMADRLVKDCKCTEREALRIAAFYM